MPVCRSGGDLLGFVLFRANKLLEQAVLINLASACKLGRVVGGGEWGKIWAGMDPVFVVGRLGAASWERGLHLLCIG